MGETDIEEEIIINNDNLTEENKKETTKTKAKPKSTAKKLRGTSVFETQEFSPVAKNIYIVFLECETSGNIGFLSRTMANFGLKNLILINPCTLDEDSYYQAMHAQDIVKSAKQYSTLDEFLNSQEIDFIIGTSGVPGGSYNLSRIPIKPEELGNTINLENKIAIIFGREGDGLTNDEIKKCDILVSIPTDPSYPIMNISHAAAIIFYEIFKHKNEFPVEGLEESNSIEKERLLKDMKEVISTLSIPEHKKRNGLKTFKNIINRAFITGREAHTLIGILRRLKMKLE